MTDARIVRGVVGSADAGARLDAWLARREEIESRAEAQRLILEGIERAKKSK